MSKNKNHPKFHVAKHRALGFTFAVMLLWSACALVVNVPALAQSSASQLIDPICVYSGAANAPYQGSLYAGTTVNSISQQEGGGYSLSFNVWPGGLPPYGVSLRYLEVLPDVGTDVGNGPGVSKKLYTGYADGTWFIDGLPRAGGETVTAISTGEPTVHFAYGCSASDPPYTVQSAALQIYITSTGAEGGAPPQGTSGESPSSANAPAPAASPPEAPSTPKHVETPQVAQPVQPSQQPQQKAPFDLHVLVGFDKDGSEGEFTNDEKASFIVDKEQHVVTFKKIGSDFAEFELRSTPIQARLKLGETKAYDVTGDGKNDIEITLRRISGVQAVFFFKRLTVQPSAAPKIVAAQSVGSGNNLIWIVGVNLGALLVAVIGLFAIPGVRKHFTLPLIRRITNIFLTKRKK